MTSAYVLIAAVLVLGGLLAVLGDRIGTKVGKARLRLFNLRPKNTAIVVTVLTGTAIAASTLGILFASSKSLRQGIFRLDDILRELRIAEADLYHISLEKGQVESELNRVNEEKQMVEQGLIIIQERYESTQEQAAELGDEVQELREQRERLVRQQQELLRQREQLLEQIPQLQGQVRERDRTIQERNQRIAAQDQVLREREQRFQDLARQQDRLQGEINERDERIQNLDEAIAERDQTLQNRESTLLELGRQLSFLQGAVSGLEEDYQRLRVGSVVLARGEVLSFGVVRILDPNAAQDAVDQLLRQANRRAIEATRPGQTEPINERVVLITEAQVQQLINQIKDGRDYVVRILSAGNYVAEEPFVRVFADVVVNQQIFAPDQVVATVSVEPDTMSDQEITERLDTLIAATQFRARRTGIVGDIQIEDGDIKKFTDFVDQMLRSGQPYNELRAVTVDSTYTSGPLKIKLVALKNGAVVFST
ncbi:DUF3084 domain-containing protein [Spirulina subsalsa FACHB-351]|uniref:DUF3084 domain-containing protein n=1 Tax=Spirulina subsalsa FACHB-351 TaxID=234711 RepID=A0ABT3LBA2_9CYAN|nr:DUF3084 domain-containing protein [Spirulina subsalsa]MCW6038771.1 DUF3084 domain-containing protein [Spirulina subsalsa FACHB-351]